MKTYNDVYLGARKRLKASGIESYNLEARLIVAKAAGKTPEHLLRDINLYVTDEFVNNAQELIERRCEGEPVAYILGEWSFLGHPIEVNHDVLIPRIDTEITASVAIEIMRKAGGKGRVLDLCTGSGCIGVAMAASLPDCRFVLGDISTEALQVARSNVLKNGVVSRCICVQSDALTKPPILMGEFNMIVSNPPYIPSGDMETLDRDVRCYEPALALDGGEDGLKFYRSVVTKWKRVLKENGYLVFECGIGQAEDIAKMMKENGFTDIEIEKDTLGIDRVVAGRIENPVSF